MSGSIASPPGLPMPEIVADLPLAPLLCRCYPLLSAVMPLFAPLLPAVSAAVIPLLLGYKIE